MIREFYRAVRASITLTLAEIEKGVTLTLAEIEKGVTLTLAEIEKGVTLIDAAAADAFETELRRITVSDEERANIRRAAVEIAKCGFTADDVATAMTEWARFHGSRLDYELDQIQRYVESRRAAL